MKLVDKCTGCMACYNSCKFNAIKIIQNEKGFYVPKIDMHKCKKCGCCEKACPEKNQIEKRRWQECYAAWSNNKDVRSTSTSGGIFYEIAKEILKESGVVFGVVFNKESNLVQHTMIKDITELNNLQGSKYVQSFVGDIYLKVKEQLDNNKLVLFSGVSCQIAGLKMYLKKSYDNLITIDVLCHGAPSPKIFDEYLNDKNFKKIEKISFRYKRPSWTVFSMKVEYSGKQYLKDTNKDEYLRLFLSDFITNEVCSDCKYTGEERIADITLADFWGYISDKMKYRNKEKGISLVLVNSQSGEVIFNKIKNYITYINKDFLEAKDGNKCLTKPYPKNKNYNSFWNDYFKYGYKYIIDKYYAERKIPIRRKISLFINDHAYIVPKCIRKRMYNIKYKHKGA